MIVLQEDANSFDKKIEQAIRKKIGQRVVENIDRAEREISNMIPSWVAEQPEMQSLTEDFVQYELPAQFGLEPGQGERAVSDVINAVSKSIDVSSKNALSENKGIQFVFSLQSGTFQRLMGLSSGTVRYGGGILPWMEWLLTAGDSIIIAGYEYTPSIYGRSGGGTMTEGSAWRVPPQYSGTIEDNFVTRALSNRQRELTQVVRRMLKK